MLKKIIKFFSPTESYWRWESSAEYARRTGLVIIPIIIIIVLIVYAF